MSIISISGKIGAGKDEVAKIIQRATNYHFEIRRFADNLKDIVCMLIGCTREQLEDREFKEEELGEEWWYYKDKKNKIYPYNSYDGYVGDKKLVLPTPRLLMQLLGTECGREILHTNVWVNSLMSEYKPALPKYKELFEASGIQLSKEEADLATWIQEQYPNWIIPDVRFPNEFKAVKDRNGITIRVNRPDFVENALTRKKFPVKVYKKEHKSETALDTAEFDYVIDNSGSLGDLEEKVLEILRKEKLI